VSDDILATSVPFILAIVLVGGALLGSALNPVLRGKIERYVFLPIWLIGSMVFLGWLIYARDWARLIYPGLTIVLGLARWAWISRSVFTKTNKGMGNSQ